MKNKLTSNRLNVNAGIMTWYVNELQKLTRQMTKECKEELAKIYKKGVLKSDVRQKRGFDSQGAFPSVSPVRFRYPQIAFDESISSQARIALNQLYKKYGDKFSDKSKKLAQSLMKKTNKYSNNQINTALKAMLGASAKDFLLKGSAITPEKSEIMKALIFENVSLIKSIPDEYFKQITGSVARSIENAEGIKQLVNELNSYGAKTNRRAQLIAQDQTRKAYNSINRRNFQENGIKKFEWVHSGGSRDPRKYHKDVLDGKVFDIDKGAPNESGKKPDYIFPGQLPYCRCIMKAVLDFED